MPTQIGVGFSDMLSAAEAGCAAACQALAPIQGRQPDLVVCFFTPNLDSTPLLTAVRAAVGDTPLMASCSAGGVIATQGLHDTGIAVLAFASDEIHAYAGVAPDLTADPQAAGRTLVQQVWSQVSAESPERNGLIMALESTHDSEAMVDVVEAIGNEAGALIPLAGGRAIDNTGRLPHSLFLDDAAYADALGMVLFLTPGPVGVGVRHGYQPVGRPLVVTHVEGNVLYELDGKSAFAAYCEQFPEHPDLTADTYALFGINHPLGLPQMGREYVIRDPYAPGPDGALLCAGALPKHSVVRIMHGDQKTLLASAREAATDAMMALDGRRPLLAMVFSCITRVNFLGATISQEMALIREVIGEETPVIGVVTYGEIAAQPDSAPAFHNKTIVIGVIGAPD